MTRALISVHVLPPAQGFHVTVAPPADRLPDASFDDALSRFFRLYVGGCTERSIRGDAQQVQRLQPCALM
jgi:hypothetical protein